MNSHNGLRRSLAFLLLCLVFSAGIAAQAFDESDGFVPETGTSQTQQPSVSVTTGGTSEAAQQTTAAAPQSDASAASFEEGFDRLLQSLNDFFSTLANLFKAFFDALGGQTSRAPARDTGDRTVTSGGTSGATTTGSTAADQTGGTTSAPNETAQRVSESAANYASRYTSAGSFRYSPGTENGNLGCADVVSQCLKDAGVGISRILNVDGVKSALTRLSAPNNWRIAQPPPYQAGDVVVWSVPPGGRHKHIGIVTRNGNSLMAMNNSSSRRHPVLSAIEYRAVECVVRKA